MRPAIKIPLFEEVALEHIESQWPEQRQRWGEALSLKRDLDAAKAVAATSLGCAPADVPLEILGAIFEEIVAIRKVRT